MICFVLISCCIDDEVPYQNISVQDVSGNYGVNIIRLNFKDLVEVDMCSLHPAIPVRMWEFRILGFEQPSYFPERVTWSEQWLVMIQSVGEFSDVEKRDDVYYCLFSACKWKNLLFGYSRDLSFAECLQLHPWDMSC